ncbi:MAG TPA: hypothetical protein PLU30_26495 [Verrucomicrobiae bacterium]|nr:hypothetical protein [Verrucomicrobiae bacterium]
MDEIELQHTLPGREASPCFERTVRLAVERAFKDLLETKNLYQKVDVDLNALPQALTAEGVDIARNGVEAYNREARLRPWAIETHHQGDNRATTGVMFNAGGISQPLGTPVEEMSLHFLVPSLRLNCPTCKDKTTFEALCSSRQSGFASPYPRTNDGKIEQVFTFFYRCVSCRAFLYTTLTHRRELRIQLCGFAPRRQLECRIKADKELRPIAEDACNAFLEGDIFGGFYHLRTFVEHHIRRRLKIPIGQQIRGDELTARYNSSLPEPLKAAIPSLSPVYDELSGHLHSRTGTPEDFTRIEQSINDHLAALRTLERYHVQDGPSANARIEQRRFD